MTARQDYDAVKLQRDAARRDRTRLTNELAEVKKAYAIADKIYLERLNAKSDELAEVRELLAAVRNSFAYYVKLHKQKDEPW